MGGTAASVVTVAGVSAALGVSILERPVSVGLATVLTVGLTQLWTRGLHEGHSSLDVLGRLILQAGGVTLAFFGLELGAARLLEGAVPTEVIPGAGSLALMGLIVLAFAVVVVLQLRLPALATSPTWARLRVHVRNGLYADALFNRLVGAFRVPSTPAASLRGQG
jgi:NAD(P)H-quinone oxidoreductase subunit 5